MSQQAYDLIKNKYPHWNLPPKTTDLSDKQITDLFREEYYERTQIGKLNEIAGKHVTGSKLVEHVFDANIMTNPAEVGRWLQESIDEVAGTNLKDKNNQYDGILGSQTRKAMKNAVEEGKVKEISKKFWQKRVNYLKRLSTVEENPGWFPRVESFKE